MLVATSELVSERTLTFAINVPHPDCAVWLLESASAYDQPIILQISERVLKTLGQPFIERLKRTIQGHRATASIHLDHCRDPALCKDAINWGASSVLFDGSRLPIGDNANHCIDVVRYAEKFNAVVEGECAPIPGDEDGIEGDEKPLVTPSLLKSFVEQTGVFMLAPFFGNIHGDYKDAGSSLNLNYLAQVRKTVGVPLVIHGGSGISRPVAQLIKDIGAGKLNISTDFKKILSKLDTVSPENRANQGHSLFASAFENLREIWIK